MTPHTTPRLRTGAVAAAVAMLAGIGLGRPELVAVALPFLLAVAAGVALARPPDIGVRVDVAPERLLDDERVRISVTIVAARHVSGADVALRLPPTMAAVDDALPAVLDLRAGVPRTMTVELAPRRWGVSRLGVLDVRIVDPVGMVAWTTTFDRTHVVRVHPSVATLRSLVRPYETRLAAGNQRSRQRGDGIELADLRPFVEGDRARALNWRATARLQEPWVNKRHPERSADVVLFVDAFGGGDGDHREQATSGALLDRSIRAAATLSAGYHRSRDRVGMVVFGGFVRWVPPGTGLRQLYRIADALLDTEVFATEAWREVGAVPPRVLPPGALVLAVTPLRDERARHALLDLRGRGYEVAVVEVVTPQQPTPSSTRPADDLARRLEALERRAVRATYERLGVPVVAWDGRSPLELVLCELDLVRRHALTGRA